MDVGLHVAAQVHAEFSKGGPSERSILKKLKVSQHRVVPGTLEWEKFCLLRRRFSTRDLGEDESLAVCLAEASRGRFLPFVTFDGKASVDARELGIATLGFLDLLCWLVQLGGLTVQKAEELEALATVRNGWKRPTDYTGALEPIAVQRRGQTVDALRAWREQVALAKGRSPQR